MPAWTEPERGDELGRLLREIDAAQRLCDVLPAGSRDRATIERTIAVLNAELRAWLEVDESRDTGEVSS